MDARRRYPSVWYLEQQARRRVPRFCWEYLAGGAGRGGAVQHNRAMLDAIRFVPRLLGDAADRLTLHQGGVQLDPHIVDGGIAHDLGLAGVGIDFQLAHM